MRNAADIIVTNPPFSLFREFVVWLLESGKQFLVIGNMNAITYKEVFPHIVANRLWLGATGNGTDMVFGAPSCHRKTGKRRPRWGLSGIIRDLEIHAGSPTWNMGGVISHSI